MLLKTNQKNDKLHEMGVKHEKSALCIKPDSYFQNLIQICIYNYNLMSRVSCLMYFGFAIGYHHYSEIKIPPALIPM